MHQKCYYVSSVLASKTFTEKNYQSITNLILADFFVGTTKLIQTIPNSQAVASDGEILSFINASVNSSCALRPPALTPGNLPFFSYGWQIPGGGGT